METGAQSTGETTSGEQQGNANSEGQTDETKPDGEVKYEFTSPEGSEVHPDVTAHFEGLAKKHNLSKDAAEGIYSETAKLIADIGVKQREALRSQWHAESTSDPEFGGKNLDANLAHAKGALNQFFSPKFADLLRDTGLENHPELIRGLSKIGKEISEDRLPGGSTQTAAKTRSPEDVMYNNE